MFRKVCLGILAGAVALANQAQDTQYPTNGQQIPAPECMHLHFNMAAQGTDGRTYPWGNHWEAENMPARDTGRTMRGPDPVDAHPQGASPYGVMDLTGNVRQWTDEFADEHTRPAIVRGGEYYRPQGSIWYFPEALRNDEHGKLLLMAPGYDRSGVVGFRCVVDAK
jgi:formylglycine-generating enzyme required for sulfatase activity